VSASAVLQGFADVLRAAVGARHEIALDVGTTPCDVFIAPARLERVALNLVLNAREATPAGGTISVRMGETTDADRPYVLLEVKDEGEGMDEETSRRAFEPFFTGRPGKKGTGLGLAVVHRLVEAAGGFVRLESAPGRGTTMRVHLPCAPAPATGRA
jgi:signal transduction histidine kinase